MDLFTKLLPPKGDVPEDGTSLILFSYQTVEEKQNPPPAFSASMLSSIFKDQNRVETEPPRPPFWSKTRWKRCRSLRNERTVTKWTNIIVFVFSAEWRQIPSPEAAAEGEGVWGSSKWKTDESGGRNGAVTGTNGMREITGQKLTAEWWKVKCGRDTCRRRLTALPDLIRAAQETRRPSLVAVAASGPCQADGPPWIKDGRRTGSVPLRGESAGGVANDETASNHLI